MVIKDSKLLTQIIFPRAIKDEGVSPGSKLLDIGCASGLFLRLCDQLGIKTYGLDYSSKLIQQAKRKTKAKLFVGDAADLHFFKANTFDVVTGFDVIEHLDSPSKFAVEAFRVLRRGGKLIITTPNLNSLGRLIMKSKWHGYSDKTHKYLFTPQSLAHTLVMAGFNITKNESPFHPIPKFLQIFANKFGLGGQIWLVAQK